MPEVQEIASFAATFLKHQGQHFKVREHFLSPSLFRYRLNLSTKTTQEPAINKLWNNENGCWEYKVPAGGETWKGSFYTQGHQTWELKGVEVRGYEMGVQFANLQGNLFLRIKFGPGGCVDEVDDSQLETYPVKTNGVLFFLNCSSVFSLPHLVLLEVESNRRMLRYSCLRSLRLSFGYGLDPFREFSSWKKSLEQHFSLRTKKVLRSICDKPFWVWYSSVQHELFNGIGKYSMTQFLYWFSRETSCC